MVVSATKRAPFETPQISVCTMTVTRVCSERLPALQDRRGPDDWGTALTGDRERQQVDCS